MRLLKIGLSGDDVKQWKQFLTNLGYDLSPNNDSSYFDEATHNATVSWQKDHGLDGDGVVGPLTWAAVGSDPITHEDPQVLPITFKQAKNYTAANRTEIKWVVIHSMEAAEASTTAETVSNWFASPGAPNASAHYCIDSDSIVQCVKETDIAWHAPGSNQYGIGLEHAGYARQTTEQWNDNFSTNMLKLSARLTAEICKRWNIPVEYIDADRLKNGTYGITMHRDVSQAFHKSDHTDPGPNFPMDQYLEWVKAAM